MPLDTYAQYHKALSLAFQVLYGLSFADIHDADELHKSYVAALKTTQAKQGQIYDQLAWELVLGVYTNLKAIDAQIARLTRDQASDCLTPIELTLLRLGLFELSFKREISSKLVIDKIIGLNREYGAEEATASIGEALEALHLAERASKEERHYARVVSIQVLYAFSFYKDPDSDDFDEGYSHCLEVIAAAKDEPDDEVEEFVLAPEREEKALAFTQELVFGVLKRLPDLDGLIKRLSRFERIGLLELAFLRLALFELFYSQDLRHPAILLEELDSQIKSLMPKTNIKELSPFALTLLRLACRTIFFNPTTPTKVVMAEALELCNQFGALPAKKFINGILDAAKKDFEAKK